MASAHRADDDAEATAKLFLTCMEKLHTLPEETLNLLHRRSFRLKSDLSTLVLRSVEKSAHETELIRTFHFSGESLIALFRYQRHDDGSQPDLIRLTTREKDSYIAERLILHSNGGNRSSILWMRLGDALSEQSEIIAEVPTGIGKTVAYLLPAAIQA